MRLLMLLEVFCLLIFFTHQQVIAKDIVCNHNTPVCECIRTRDEVCEFTLDIEMLQTFTRYVVDDNQDSRGTAGRVWYYDNAGNLQPQGEGPCGSDIPIGNDQCTDPFTVDGYTFRSFIAVNGRIPGPTLIVTEGQLVKVTVTNRLASESVSVHWHGMHQRNSNWMDGVEHVTQCGIPPGASFTYIFKAEQYGTHWYHSHSGAQRTDGLFGALIVREKDDTQRSNLLSKLRTMSTGITYYDDNPDQHTLSFLDWQKSSSLDLFTQIHSGIRYFDVEKASDLSGSEAGRTTSSDGADIGPVPYWAGLINGRGRHKDIDYSTVNKFELSDFKVTAGNTYRFRLIGAQSLYAYRFSIEQHNLTVIATDGQFIEPIEVDYIIIHSGERYDFLLKAKETTTTRQFMIRAVILNFTAASTYLEEQSAEAILNYNSATTPSTQYAGIAERSQTVSERCTATNKCIALNCPFKNFPRSFNIDCIHINDLKLLTGYPNEDMPTFADSRLFFNFGFEGTRQTSAINARNLKLPSASLAQLNDNELDDITAEEFCKGLDNSDKCNRDNGAEVISPECYCTHVTNVDADQSIELVLSATGPDYGNVDPKTSKFLFAHPVHLHGHYFHVVDIGFGATDPVSGKLLFGTTNINCGPQSTTDSPMLCSRPSWNRVIEKNFNYHNILNSKTPLKDTVLIPAGGYAVVYFKTDNPGWWFLHCHIEVHQLEGMGVIINEGGKKTPAPKGMHKCGNFSFTVEEYKKAIKGISGTYDKPENCPFLYCGIFVLFLLLFVGMMVLTMIFCCCLLIKRCRDKCWNKIFECCSKCCKGFQVDP